MWEEFPRSVSTATNISTTDELMFVTETHFNNTPVDDVRFIYMVNNVDYQGNEYLQGKTYEWVDYEGCPTRSLVYGGCEPPYKIIVGTVTLNQPGISLNNSGYIVMTSNNGSVSGVQIRYTNNGSTPTSSSTLYTGPISFTGTKTFKAICVANGYGDSPVTTQTYTRWEEPTITEIYQ